MTRGTGSSAEADTGRKRLPDTHLPLSLVEYAYYNLDYIDNSRIGVTGHSMGGGNTWGTAQHYGRKYLEALAAAQDPASEGGA